MATAGGIKAGKAFVLIEAVDKTGAILRAVHKRMQGFASRMNSLGRGMVTKGLMGLLPAGLSLKIFAQFDDSMRKVEARSAGTADEMKALRDQAKELGRTTSNTASQIGELQAKLAQKGFNRGQILAMTPAVRNLAEGGGEGNLEEDTTLASDLVSGTLRAFNMEADQAGRVADVMTAAVNNSNFTLQSLIDSMKYAAPVASQFNLGLEETVATLAQMTNVNLDASTAGTSLRNMLLRLSDAKLRGAWLKQFEQATGRTIELTDAAGNLKSLPEILFAVGEATKGLGNATRADLFNQLFGVRAITGALTIGADENPFRDLLDTLKNSQGVAQRTAETMNAGLGGAFRGLWSAVEGVAISVGEALTPAISTLARGLSEILPSVADWITRNQSLVVSVVSGLAAVVGLGAGLVGLGVAVSLIATGIGGLAAVASAAAGVLGLLMSPVVLIGAAIVAAGAAIWIFRDQILAGLSAVPGLFAAAWQSISSGWSTAVGVLSGAWTQFVDLLGNTWSAAVGMLQSAWSGLAGWISGAIGGLASTVGGLFSAIFQDLFGRGSGVAGGIFRGLLDALLGAWSMFTIAVGAVWKTGVAVIGGTLRAVGALLKGLAGVAVAVLSPVWRVLSTAFLGAWDMAVIAVGGIWSGLVAILGATWSGFVALVMGQWGNTIGWFGRTWQSLRSGVTGFASAVISTFQAIGSTITGIWSGIGSTAGGVWQWIQDASSSAFTAIAGYLGEIPGAFQDVFGGIAGFVSERFGQLGETIGQTFGGVLEALTAGDFEAAWELVTDGLGLAWSQMVDTLADAWDSFTGFFVEAWVGATTAIGNLWDNVSKSISTGILDLASQSGILGDLLDVVMGVDVSDEKARGEALEKKRKELLERNGQQYIPQADAFTEARQAMRDKFDQQIAGRTDAAGQQLADREKARSHRDQARQQDIDRRRQALRDRLQGTGYGLTPEEKQAQADQIQSAHDASAAILGVGTAADQMSAILDGMEADRAAKQAQAASLAGDISAQPAALPPKISQGLERGTAEAMQQFQENRFAASEFGKMLDAQAEANEHLATIAENTASESEEGV